MIKKCALTYASNNKNLFKEENIVYIKVQDLIDSNILLANEEGIITNPLKNNESMNNNVVKLKLEDGKVDVTVDG